MWHLILHSDIYLYVDISEKKDLDVDKYAAYLCCRLLYLQLHLGKVDNVEIYGHIDLRISKSICIYIYVIC